MTPQGQFANDFSRIEQSFQFPKFRVLTLTDSRLLHLVDDFGPRNPDGIAISLLDRSEPLMQLLLESPFAKLLKENRLASLVDFECFIAVGADNFVQFSASGFFAATHSVTWSNERTW